MKKELLQYLVCPNTGEQLRLEIHEESEGEVKSGLLVSEGGDFQYPITGFIPRFVPKDEYADTFSKQRLYVRRHFRHYKNDRSGDESFVGSTGFGYQDLSASGPVLEVGCGYGRYLDVLSRENVRFVVGIDLSTHSIELAQDFVGLRPGVHLVQCDLFKLPFREGTFGHIFSLGVLHHTPSTKDAFDSMVPYLERGGRIAIWVYPKGSKTMTDVWRTFTTRLPHSVLYAWCVLNQVTTGWIRRLPGGWRLGWLIPGAQPKPGRHFWQRVLSDFDNLSPVYAHSHSSEEVLTWFREAGLTEVRGFDRKTAVAGRKALTAEASSPEDLN